MNDYNKMEATTSEASAIVAVPPMLVAEVDPHPVSAWQIRVRLRYSHAAVSLSYCSSAFGQNATGARKVVRLSQDPEPEPDSGKRGNPGSESRSHPGSEVDELEDVDAAEEQVNLDMRDAAGDGVEYEVGDRDKISGTSDAKGSLAVTGAELDKLLQVANPKQQVTQALLSSHASKPTFARASMVGLITVPIPDSSPQTHRLDSFRLDQSRLTR